MSDDRLPFAPSPRPPLPISTLFTCLVRDTADTRACIRRASNSTRAYVRCPPRTHRWLFAPPRPPLTEECES